MEKNLDLSGVPPDQRSRIHEMTLHKIDRLWHKLEKLSYEKTVIDVVVEQESAEQNLWTVTLELDLPIGMVRSEISRCAGVEVAIDKAFSETAGKVNRRHEEKKRQRTLKRDKMARDDSAQWREELNEALSEVRDQEEYRFLAVHLDSLQRDAVLMLEKLEEEGELDKGVFAIHDVVQDALMEAYEKHASRPANIPLASWFSQILHDVIDRDRKAHSDLVPLAGKNI
jgi:hypothetical protein